MKLSLALSGLFTASFLWRQGFSLTLDASTNEGKSSEPQVDVESHRHPVKDVGSTTLENNTTKGDISAVQKSRSLQTMLKNWVQLGDTVASDGSESSATDINTGIDHTDTITHLHPSLLPLHSHFQSPFATRNLETVPCGGIVVTYPQETIAETFDAYADVTMPDALTAIILKTLFANNKTYGVQIMKVCASCDSVVAAGAGAAAGAQDLYDNPSFDHYCGENAYGHNLEHSGLVYLPLVGNDVRPGTMPGYVYSRPTKVGKLDQGPSVDLDTSLDYVFGLMATMAMGTISFAPDFMGHGVETTAEKGYLLRDTYLTSSLPLWLWVSNFVSESTDSRSALGDTAFYVGASEGGYATVALAEGFRTALGVEPVYTFASAGPYRMGTATLMDTIINTDAGVDFDRHAYIAILLGSVYSSSNPNAANYGQGQDLLNDENRELALSWLNNPDFSKEDINAEIFALHERINGVDTVYRIEDLWNPIIVNFLRDASAAGVEDPCNPDYEGYIVGENDKFCEALKQNDLIDVLEKANYDIELCHSPGDTLVTYSNMPDVSVNAFLTANIKAGGHEESIGFCFFDVFGDIVSEKFLSFVPEPKHKSDPDSGSNDARGGTSNSAHISSLSFTSTVFVIAVGLGSSFV
uniref:Uncharacterized protein n=2 Tax=Chaetoceros debilis TaxID=122233 RepID=A0A7S3Q4M5_9STRA